MSQTAEIRFVQSMKNRRYVLSFWRDGKFVFSVKDTFSSPNLTQLRDKWVAGATQGEIASACKSLGVEI